VTFYASKASFDAAVATTLLEDFESFAPKDTPLPFFISNGVTYTAFAGAPFPNVWVASPGYSNFGAGVPQPTTTSILVANGDEDFTAEFSVPPLALGFDTYLNGLGPASLQVFNGATLLDTFTYAAALDDKEYLGIVSTDPITSIRWTSTDGGVLNTGIDNLSVPASTVPESGSLWILLAIPGVVGLSAFRRLRISKG
jgi:hypothetical protein